MKTHLLNLLTAILLICTGSLLMVPSALAQDHLLISEITLAPDSGEFIEIYNPTSNSISLDNYYLADNMEYALIATSSTNVSVSDFIARFPSGYTILPGQVMVIAIRSDLFTAYYGVVPDFELFVQNMSIPDMVAVNVGTNATITNAGEGVVLFYWDGSSDLVSDVDIINVGIPTTANKIVSKTGLMVNSSTYLNDAGTMPQQMSAPGIGFSTKRKMLEGTHEIQIGGNGIIGNDETSENILVTWDSAYTAPTPGIVDLATGINQLNFSEKIRIYPNPTNGKFNLDLPYSILNLKVELVNILGEKIYSDLINTSSEKVEMNVEDVTPGIYFLKLSNNEFRTTKKIIIR